MFREIPLPLMNFGISTFSIMLVIAFLLGSYLIPRELLRKNLNPEVSDWVILLGVVGAIVGSKIGYVFEIWGDVWIDPTEPNVFKTIWYVLSHWEGLGFKNGAPSKGFWSSLFSGGGLVFQGGFVVCFSMIYYYLKRQGLEVWRYADCFMPTLAIGYAIGRLGCLVSGDGCYGHAASVHIPLITMTYEPLSIFKSIGDGVWNTPYQTSMGVNVWNTPFIEAVISFGLFLIFMMYVRHQNFKPGFSMAFFMVYNGIARFFIEFLRLNDSLIDILDKPSVTVAQRYTREGLLNWHWYGFNQPQLIGVAMLIAGLTWIIVGKLYVKEGATPAKA